MRAAHAYHFSLSVRNRERGEGHSNKATNLDLARKLRGAVDKKNVRNSRLEVMEKCRLLCVGMWDQLLCSISVCCQFLVNAHAKF